MRHKRQWEIPKKVARSNTLELTDADFHAKIKAEGAMLVEFMPMVWQLQATCSGKAERRMD